MSPFDNEPMAQLKTAHSINTINSPSLAFSYLFISDLHLNENEPQTMEAFVHFIKTTVVEENAKSVFILGDFFDFWIGDDMLSTPFVKEIVRHLRTLNERGIALFIMHGNRDFLLGARFATETHATLINDPHIIKQYGKQIVLSHGDLLCTDDMSYQRFRLFVRMPTIQKLFLILPFSFKLWLAKTIRAISYKKQKLGQKKKSFSFVSDINEEAVEKLFNSTDTDTMIHGHIHQPGKYQKNNRSRWVLSDWDFHTKPTRGNYLRLNKEGIKAIDIA